MKMRSRTTLEANPETVTEESLAGFREAGVNRISFGVQSARDTQLRTLGRPHTAKQARAAFAAAQRAGFANIRGDIMQMCIRDRPYRMPCTAGRAAYSALGVP